MTMYFVIEALPDDGGRPANLPAQPVLEIPVDNDFVIEGFHLFLGRMTVETTSSQVGEELRNVLQIPFDPDDFAHNRLRRVYIALLGLDIVRQAEVLYRQRKPIGRYELNVSPSEADRIVDKVRDDMFASDDDEGFGRLPPEEDDE